MENFTPAFDAYIAKSADFAKPILTHLRLLVHQACPGIEEKLKWGHPFFDYNGPVCQIAAFKQHLGLGFWKARLLTDPHKVLKLDDEESAAGNFGRISSLADLPADNILIAYIQEAVQLNKDGVKVAPKPKPATEKKEAVMPAEFADMLDGNADAKAHFERFSPSKKKEYIEWFVDAKSEATKQKRMEQALEWISEGKSRHWKYQS
jgi:uncharacterized protein YdeI (YjbR/CyaY-like superfamily)